jgi:simple sugar transport system permease protein
MHELLAPFASSSYWDSVLLLATPIVLAALATLIASRAGTMFVAIEGTMLISCFAAVATTARSGSILMGIVVGVLAGAATGLFSAWLSIDLHAGDVAGGLVVAIGGLGLTSFIAQRAFPSGTYLGPDQRLRAPWGAPGDSVLHVILDQPPLLYVAIVLAAAIVIFLRTRVGLRMRACGEAMEVAQGFGISVRRTRYLAAGVAGAVGGLAGVSLGLSVVGSFDGNPVSGRGFIALACVMLGGWRPLWVVLAALFFSAADVYGFQTTAVHAQDWGPMLPYILTLVALGTLQRRRQQGPRDEGRSLDELPRTPTRRWSLLSWARMRRREPAQPAATSP